MSNKNYNRFLLFIRVLSVFVVGILGITYKNEVIVAFGQLASIGWAVLLIFPLFGIWNFAAACGWHGLVGATPRDFVPSRLRLFIIRIEAQAINIVAPLLSISGEVLKTSLIAEKRGQITSAPSVILDVISSTIAALIFSIVGASFYFTSVSLEPGFFVFVISSSFVVCILFFWNFWLRLLNRVLTLPKNSGVKNILNFLEGSSALFSRPFRRGILWHLVERILMGGEIFIVAWSLGYPIDISEALFATAVMSGFTLFLFFIPAQIGAAEGALALAFSILGFPPSLGLSVALMRRARQMITLSIGLTIFVLFEGFKFPQRFRPTRWILNGRYKEISS